jgi:hypothetical protein
VVFEVTGRYAVSMMFAVVYESGRPRWLAGVDHVSGANAAMWARLTIPPVTVFGDLGFICLEFP